MSACGHTTKFLFQDDDYLVAMTDRNCVRIGLKGEGPFYDIPADHAYYDRACEATNRADVEDLHDELSGHYCGESA